MYISFVYCTYIFGHSCTHLELSTLADLMGPYGIRYLGEQPTELVSSQVKELKVRRYSCYHYSSSCILEIIMVCTFSQKYWPEASLTITSCISPKTLSV